jgi:hypothetical protein
MMAQSAKCLHRSKHSPGVRFKCAEVIYNPSTGRQRLVDPLGITKQSLHTGSVRHHASKPTMESNWERCWTQVHIYSVCTRRHNTLHSKHFPSGHRDIQDGGWGGGGKRWSLPPSFWKSGKMANAEPSNTTKIMSDALNILKLNSCLYSSNMCPTRPLEGHGWMYSVRRPGCS